MSAVFPDEGLQRLIEFMVNKTASANLKLRLFKNNYTPVAGSVLADFTEVTVAGYAAVTLTGSSWTVAVSSSVATATYPAVTFTFTGTGETVYGYYVVDNGTAKVLWAEKLGTAYAIPGAGGSVTITPSVSDLNCP